VSRNQKGKTNLDLNEARDSEWQWHQLGHMQVCTLLQTDNHTSTLPLSFLQTRCPSCCRTNSINALLSIKITATDFSLLPGNSVLGGRKGIRPVKKLSGGVLAWLSVWS